MPRAVVGGIAPSRARSACSCLKLAGSAPLAAFESSSARNEFCTKKLARPGTLSHRLVPILALVRAIGDLVRNRPGECPYPRDRPKQPAEHQREERNGRDRGDLRVMALFCEPFGTSQNTTIAIIGTIARTRLANTSAALSSVSPDKKAALAELATHAIAPAKERK